MNGHKIEKILGLNLFVFKNYSVAKNNTQYDSNKKEDHDQEGISKNGK